MKDSISAWIRHLSTYSGDDQHPQQQQQQQQKREKAETVDRSQFDVSEAFVTAPHNSPKSLAVP